MKKYGRARQAADDNITAYKIRDLNAGYQGKNTDKLP
jgi:hypothetical protein